MNGVINQNHKKLIDWGVASRPMNGQQVSGDMHVVETFHSGVLLGAIDGVGHGDGASEVAQIAARVLKKHCAESVITLVNQCHTALALTRGAVITLASLDAVDGTLTWMGVGNVEARLFRAQPDLTHPSENILLRGGLLGLQLPTLQASIMPIIRDDLLIFATDGIRAGFDQAIALTDSPQQIADRILDKHFKGTDDALVLVARYRGIKP